MFYIPVLDFTFEKAEVIFYLRTFVPQNWMERVLGSVALWVVSRKKFLMSEAKLKGFLRETFPTDQLKQCLLCSKGADDRSYNLANTYLITTSKERITFIQFISIYPHISVYLITLYLKSVLHIIGLMCSLYVLIYELFIIN